MRKVIVNEFMSLDGVVQAAGGADEDRTAASGTAVGTGYGDDLGPQWVVEYMTEAGGFLLGRRTYEIFAGYWPNASEGSR